MSSNFNTHPPLAAPASPVPAAKPEIRKPLLSAANVLLLFTLHFLGFLWADYLGLRPYPGYFTTVYLAVLAGVSLSNLLRRSRWFA